MPEWAPEVTVDEAFARRLIAGQFPDVPLESLRLLGEGWDNTVWLVDEQWVFRFPRRTLAIPGVEREIAALAALAPRLPLPVPAPVFVGEPADGFPWPFFGARFLPGREPLGLSAAERAGLARPFGELLRALHDADVADLPAPEPTVVCHGDLHVRHLLVDDAGALTGVIDWGDLCRGDPSVDLSLVWSLLPARDAFLAAYGPVSDDQLLRARVIALFLCAVLALYAHHEGMRELELEALAGLDRAS